MIFLIDFDRDRTDLRILEAYPEQDRLIAEAHRLEIELAMDWKTAPREVVIIQAEDEAALRKGYGRYFKKEGRPDEAYEKALRQAKPPTGGLHQPGRGRSRIVPRNVRR